MPLLRLDLAQEPRLLEIETMRPVLRSASSGPAASFFCEDAVAGRLAKLVPGGHTATVPAAAHYPNMEKPARCIVEPTSFLETV
ncbi:hypothetical protein ACFWOJ_25755 [Streptomyces sp. NPDC058439]|uniref:hypothetical protein n=1 Tax=Streptomyces sp. NPDC058439 TaxID=3346500 RepID=UPI00365748FA